LTIKSCDHSGNFLIYSDDTAATDSDAVDVDDTVITDSDAVDVDEPPRSPSSVG